MKKIQIIVILIMMYSCASAVSINPGGLGEAVILPYYTVNNDLNTVITINNSTSMTKAIKINFREGKAGITVLSFNLYLAPNDMWTAALAPDVSSVVGHVGEQSVRLFMNDQSCAPFLVSGQEFLPFEIDAESGDTDLFRSREGYIEVIEMGELDPSFGMGLNATFSFSGGNNCTAIQAAYEFDGIWGSEAGDFNEQLLPVKGGLVANLGIIDVAEGLMYSMDGLAFESFFPENSIFHTSPGDTKVPSLADAETTSVVILNGLPVSTEWDHGYQAISALLMKDQIESFYDLNPNLAAKTEVVLSMPTKRFYQNIENAVELPFIDTESEQYNACAIFDVGVFDRDTSTNICTNDPGGWGIGCHSSKATIDNPNLTPIPPGIDNDRYLCHAVSVLDMRLESTNGANESSKILGSQSFQNSDVVGFESGKMLMAFEQMTPSPAGDEYAGLPVLAYTFVKYTNANAVPGLLAQYGGVNKSNYKVQINAAEAE